MMPISVPMTGGTDEVFTTLPVKSLSEMPRFDIGCAFLEGHATDYVFNGYEHLRRRISRQAREPDSPLKRLGLSVLRMSPVTIEADSGEEQACKQAGNEPFDEMPDDSEATTVSGRNHGHREVSGSRSDKGRLRASIER